MNVRNPFSLGMMRVKWPVDCCEIFINP